MCIEAQKDWTVIFPDEDKINHITQIEQARVLWATELKEFFEAKPNCPGPLPLVDGFDDYRHFLDVRLESTSSPFKKETRCLKEDEWKGADLAIGVPFQEIANNLAIEIQGVLPQKREEAKTKHGFFVLAAPFDEDPRKLAFYLAEALCQKWWKKIEKSDYRDLPVIVPVSLSEFFSADAAGSRTVDVHGFHRHFARTTAGYLQKEFPKWKPSLEYPLQNALRKPGKLLLICFDDQSLTLWPRLAAKEENKKESETALARYRQILQALRDVGEPEKRADSKKHDPLPFGWQSQFVVFVASDFHHQLLVSGPEPAA